MDKLLVVFLIELSTSCQTREVWQSNVVTSDIINFCNAYDLVVQEPDALLQVSLLDSLYIKNGTLGLEKMMEIRDYTAIEYVELINK